MSPDQSRPLAPPFLPLLPFFRGFSARRALAGSHGLSLAHEATAQRHLHHVVEVYLYTSTISGRMIGRFRVRWERKAGQVPADLVLQLAQVGNAPASGALQGAPHDLDGLFDEARWRPGG